MAVDVRVRRFAQSDAERTLLRIYDPAQRENLAKAMGEYYTKLKTDTQSITSEDVKKLLRTAFKAYSTQTADTLDIFEQYRIFTGKHIYNMRETHPNVATLKHKHAKARQELGDVAEPLNNLRTLLAIHEAEAGTLTQQIHAYEGDPEDSEVIALAARLTSVEGIIEEAKGNLANIQKRAQELDATISRLEINITLLEALGRMAVSTNTASSVSDSLGGDAGKRNIQRLQAQLEAATEIAGETPDEKALNNIALAEKVKAIQGGTYA